MRKLKKSMALLVALAMVLTTFGFTAVSAAGFSDATGHWAEAVIDKWSNSGVVNGYEDGTFMPDAYISRAELAKVISSARGYTVLAEIDFADVQGDEWFVSDLRKCVAQNVIGGYEDGTFRPNDAVTREEAATMFQRAYGINAIGLLNFTDNDSISEWAKTSVTALVGAGVINGYEDGSFAPSALITRAEVVKVLDGITTAAAEPQSTASGISTGVANGIGNLGGGNRNNGSSGGGYTSSSTYRVTFNANGGSFTGGKTTTSISVTKNAVIGSKAPEPRKDDYIFDGWYTSANAADSLDSANKWDLYSDTVSENITLYAGWYTTGTSVVTFETNNGTPAVASQEVENGSYASEPTDTLTRTGYTFKGWYKKNNTTVETEKFDFNNTAIKTDTVIYAGWQIEPEYAGLEITMPNKTTGTERVGTIVASPAKALPGESVILRITPPSADSNGEYGVKNVEVWYANKTEQIKNVSVYDADDYEKYGYYSYKVELPSDGISDDIEVVTNYFIVPPPTASPTPTPGPTATPEPTAEPTPTVDPNATPEPTSTPSLVTSYVFSEGDFANLTSVPANTEIGGITVSAASDVAASNKTFSVTDDYPNNSKYSYSKQLKIGKATVSFKVDGPCKITVDAVSANSSSDRAFTVTAGTTALGTFTCYGGQANSFVGEYEGMATTVTIKPSDGINLYGIHVEKTGSIEPEPSFIPRYGLNVDGAIQNGSISVSNGSMSTDDINSVVWTVENVKPDELTDSSYNSDGTTSLIAMSGGEVVNINGVDSRDGTITAYDDMNWCRHLGVYSIHNLQNNPTKGMTPPFNEYNVPGGNVFMAKAGRSGYMTFVLYIFGNKAFRLYDNSNEKYIESFTTTAEAIHTFTFPCEAGGEYYAWADGSKIGLVSVIWSESRLFANEGQEVTITTKPNDGYKVSSVSTEPAAAVTQTGENTYTFTMPANAVTISAEFVGEGEAVQTPTPTPSSDPDPTPSNDPTPPDPGDYIETTPVTAATEWMLGTADFGDLLETFTVSGSEKYYLKGNTSYNGLEIYADAGELNADGSKVSGTVIEIDNGKKSVDGVDYVGRLKFGGNGTDDGASSKRLITLMPGVAGKLTIVASHASGSGNPARQLMVMQGDTNIDEGISVDGGETKKQSFNVAANEIVRIYPVGGINIHYIAFEPAQ